MKEYTYTVILEHDQEIDEYAVLVPALPGCWSQGKTPQEALVNVREAIIGFLETLQAHGEPVPVEDRVERVKVAVV
jgi:predicted RNase H-like HicB family nuclease